MPSYIINKESFTATISERKTLTLDKIGFKKSLGFEINLTIKPLFQSL